MLIAVEAYATETFRQDLVDRGIVIKTEQLAKDYPDRGGASARALWRRSRDPARRIHCHHGPLRLGEIHAHESARLPRRAFER